MGLFRKPKDDTRTPLDRYFDEAEGWETQLVASANRRVRAATLMSALSAGCLLATVGVIWTMIPLKQLEPVVIVADRTTGFLEVSRPLAEAGSLQADEAITMANVVRYVRAREGYDIHDVQDTFHMAKVLSGGDVARELEDTFASHNADNPVRRYGRDTTIVPHVKSVQFPNPKTAVVRFSTETRARSGTVTDHYTSIVRFQYTGEPLRNAWRFDNPLGFQVVGYRRDQEVVRPESVAQLP